MATLLGHTSQVQFVAFSPDGDGLASASWDDTVKLWDVNGQQEVATLQGHTQDVSSVAFSPGGGTLATASDDGTVKLWDVSARQERATLPGHTDGVRSIAFSPSGEVLATSSDLHVNLWDVSAGQELAALHGHVDRVDSVAFSPDGDTIASGGFQRVKLWDVSAEQEITTLHGHASWVSAVAFSPAGGILASGGDDDTVRLWDVNTEQGTASLEGHTEIIRSIAFSPDGAILASASDDGTVKLWDVDAHREIATLQGHTSWVWALAFSPNGRTLASGSTDNTVKLWDVDTRQETATLQGHAFWLRGVAFSRNGNVLASASSDGTVKLWDVHARQEIATLLGHTASPTSVAFAPQGHALASGSSDGTVLLWDMSPYVPSPHFAARSAWVVDRDANADGVANPGERVELRARMKNEGALDAANVVATLTTADTDVTVVNGEATHATWPAGAARDNVGFVLDIAPDATPHDVTVVVDVTADNGGPWQFTYTFAIEPPPPGLASRNFWARDAVSGNGDGEANPGERVEIKARLKHEGETDLLNVVATLSGGDGVTVIDGEVTHATWPAGVARNNDGLLVEIDADATGPIEFTLDVTADNGGPWQFTYTLPIVGSAPAPVFTARSSWIRDKDTGNADGQADAGERVEFKVRLRNDGPGDAQNVGVALSSADDVTIVDEPADIASWPAGVARTSTFLVDIGAGASGEAAFALSVTADSGGPWQFTYALPIVAAGALPSFTARSSWIRDKDTGNADGQADAGETVEFKVRVRNDGPGDAHNVAFSFSTTGDIVSWSSPAGPELWPAGVAKTLTFDVEIGADATGELSFGLEISADTGGPWQSVHTVPVVAASVAPAFASRSSWIRDKVTGDADGQAEGGERIEFKARLRNDGPGAAQNVAVSLTSEADVTVVQAPAPLESWSAETARTNTFLVDIGSGVAGDVTFTVHVTADNGGPWEFPYTISVVAAPAAGLAARSFWARDRRTGNDDGDANPGERVQIKARLKNESDTEFTNVVSTLSTDNPNITIVSAQKTYGTWAAGAAKNNDGLLIDVGSDASGSVAFTLDVTADNGGPWQYTYSLPIVTLPTNFAMRSGWARDKDTGDGDGQSEAGERVEVRVRLKNEGQIAGENVVVTLSTTDVNATVASATVTHATWPAGVARNNAGLLVDLGEAVGGTVSFVVDVTADNAGPWQFTFDLPVSAPAAPALLASGLPTRSAALPNYPNPFNPETWIPFELAESSDVTVRVYDMRGHQVRRLDLGYLDAGRYHGRSAAAHWDGRNDIGEAVASGVYVYEVRAGSFVERRRMVIRK